MLARPTTRSRIRARLVILFRLFVLIALSAGSAGAAREPVIETGREREVQNLFLPHRLGAEIASGWRLQNIRIAMSTIEVELLGAPGKTAKLTLVHPDKAPSAKLRSKNFALSVGEAPDESARRALLLLAESVRRNDTAPFWRVHAEPPAPALAPKPRRLSTTSWVVLALAVFAALGALLWARRRKAAAS